MVASKMPFLLVLSVVYLSRKRPFACIFTSSGLSFNKLDKLTSISWFRSWAYSEFKVLILWLDFDDILFDVSLIQGLTCDE